MTSFACLWAPLALALIGALTTTEAYAEDRMAESAEIKVESLAKLDNPWAVKVLPDGRLLITEKPGNLRIYSDGKLSAPVKGTPKVEYHDQGGLLDVALDPGFAENGLIYLSFTEAAETQPNVESDEKDPRLGDYQDLDDTVLKGAAVARGRLDGESLSGVTIIWRQDPKTIGRGHFGGRLVFAPDGKLFITSGERQRFEPAQDLSGNLGKVVRINPDGSIPADNPFVGKEGARGDIWTLGHRNPLGAAINPASGELWIHEMGPKGGDEVNIVVKGKNYGWPQVSDGSHYDDEPIPPHKDNTSFAKPVKSWNPSISPAGLIFYRGTLFPNWQGNLLMGGLSSEALFRLKLDGDRVQDEEKIDMGERIRDVAEAPDGAVLLLTDGDDGELLRLVPKDAKAAAGDTTKDRATP